MLDQEVSFWSLLLALAHLLISLAASAHIVLHKKDTRAAIGWVGIVWLTPFLGTLLYVMFGVNRIRRRAIALRFAKPRPDTRQDVETSVASVTAALGPENSQFDALARVAAEVTQRPLLSGNRIEPLVNGDQAYPVMLAAIDEAKESINLSSYIFDNDRAGRQFLEALRRAVERGVDVRVLVDDVGARYTWPPIIRSLRKAGIRTEAFMPTLLPWKVRYSNLRSHRKVMIVDSRLGYTGGMNIREGNLLALQPRSPVQDIHFRIEGPVVSHLQEVFVTDWAFCTQEILDGPQWFPTLPSAGSSLARGVTDGPDDDFDKLHLVLLAAIGCAQSSLLIMTPYFLPDAAILTALNVAALRGVEVNLVLPQVNNLRLVQWASMSFYDQLLTSGVKIWLSPPPFEHSKLMVVDAAWTLLGSANWDARSLSLNFEFNIECYDRRFAESMDRFIRARIAQSRPVDAESLENRPLVYQLRDGVARLASPYL